MILKHLKSSGISFLSLLFLCILHTPPLFSQSPISISEPVEGDLKILAVMVEFQPDENPYTSGNGTFDDGAVSYLENPGTNIDALPHNRQYFEAHLEFTKNYFQRMSDGKLIIEYFVLPEIVRLPKEMAEYSPIGPEPDLSILSELTKDVWESLSEVEVPNSFIGENTAFVIFHAGIGRDIELTGTTLNRTPQDIPSVYLSQSALADMFDDPNFSGFPLQNGDLLVSNTLILPRTLTRAGEEISGETFVIPLSINGMLTAQIGSHLGLPDLFNTETGQSGIGRFGLMDGAGIFAYNGLFPPEMSAWEKIYLGWTTPFSVDPLLDNTVTLPASYLREPNSIARINLSVNEYYLIENRHRDPVDEGISITIQRDDGTTVVQQFSNLDDLFVNQVSGFDELLEPGVITDVSNFDFALPGGYDESNDRHLNGGILIWHVDESVIGQKIDQNRINSNPNRRGISLVEADGAQDIGRPVSAGLFQNPSNGSPFDFWWSGNNATVITQTGEITLYQNRFGPVTTPANRSHSGSPASFELFDFSDNLVHASFSIQPASLDSDFYTLIESRSDLDIEPFTPSDDTYFNHYPLSLFPDSDGNSLFITGRNGVQVYNTQTGQLSDRLSTVEKIQQPLFVSDSYQLFIASAPAEPEQSLINIERYQFDSVDWQVVSEFSVPSNRGNISSVEPGILDLDGIPFRYDLQSGVAFPTQNRIIYRTETDAGAFAQISEEEFILSYPGGTVSHPLFNIQDYERLYAGLIRSSSKAPSFYLLEGNNLNLYSDSDGYSSHIQISKSSAISRPAVTDLTGDGNPDFIFINVEEQKLHAVNSNGAMISHFPISPKPGISFMGTPLIADLNGDDELNILVAGVDVSSLNLYAFNMNGDLLEGFPLLVGGYSDLNQNIVNPVIFNTHVAAVSPAGDFKLWHFPALKEIRWGSVYGNTGNNKSTATIPDTQVTEPGFTFLNKEETYNWPNPARDETTIRFQTDGEAEIRIQISTLSGRTIYHRTVQSRGGSPEEITVDTSDWASGGYIARITAKNGNRSESKLVNIAIIK
ncbi:T9SS-dependent M6-like inactivated metalloprotease [Rhodohalobacter halophilus]|uniref:T9SS-dependent M6-like inactivated metalloprotease n=1 Tax=Rhodohalobacter halophilus TaxID=1812810 RepID=UPI00083FB171|nr:T9SS type A sorting domain-containing protein [Rhodohalobacter halophilus]